jgi:oxygen-dependent protoporphyrinogen oxidase
VQWTTIAYPMFLSEYDDDRRCFQHATGVDGLRSIGRNSEFSYTMMKDVYWRTLKYVNGLSQ